jgi:glycosyltransferase involved in cell wall biosynthesis
MQAENNKIRICFLIDALETSRAGTEKQLLKLMDGLQEDKYQCYLACFKNTPWLRENKLKWPVFLVGSNSLKTWQFYIGMYRLGVFLKREKINIVQVHFPLSVTAGMLCARLAGVGKIVSCRRDMGFWYTKALLFVLKVFNRWVDRFIVNSIEIKRLIQKTENIHPDKITVIHNGIDPPPESDKIKIEDFRRKHGILAETCVVGIVSNMNRVVKRLDVFLKAASILLKHQAEIFFVVVGEGKYLKDLKQMADEAGITEKVLFYGSHPNPINIIPAFDICVNTSDSEGFSNAVLEYMICGKPVVATGIGGNLEVVVDGVNGFLFPPGDVLALSRKIEALSSDCELRQRMGGRGKAKALHFTYDNMLSEFENEYEKLIKRECR